MEIKNQHQMALYYLITFKSFSLKDVIVDSLFYKFQSRLGEIELEHGLLAERTRKKFTNTFGNKSSYIVYDVIDINKCKELISKY